MLQNLAKCNSYAIVHSEKSLFGFTPQSGKNRKSETHRSTLFSCMTWCPNPTEDSVDHYGRCPHQRSAHKFHSSKLYRSCIASFFVFERRHTQVLRPKKFKQEFPLLRIKICTLIARACITVSQTNYSPNNYFAHSRDVCFTIFLFGDFISLCAWWSLGYHFIEDRKFGSIVLWDPVCDI